MKKTTKMMVAISVLAFITFLIAYGDLWYEFGLLNFLHGGRPIGASEFVNVVPMFLIPIFYLVLLVVALVLLRQDAAQKKWPHIAMAILNFGPMVLFWAFDLLYPLINETVSFDLSGLWFPIAMTVMTFVIAVCYVSIAVDIAKSDRERAQKKSGVSGPGKEIAG